MRATVLFLLTSFFFAACDDSRIYEKNYDFENRSWLISDKPEFEIIVADTSQPYNIYCNLRNSITYPYSRIFLTYYLQDSTGKELQSKLINHLLFDPKTGEPQGTSGLGDIYDHRLLLLKDQKFSYSGKHRLKFEQFMRNDTLPGIFAIGVRMEKVANSR